MSKTQEINNVFGVYQEIINNVFTTIHKEVSKFYQDITDLQQQYIQSFENMIKTGMSIQQEFTNKAGINTNIPDAVLIDIKDTDGEIKKIHSFQTQMVQTVMDATKQRVNTFNENVKSFADFKVNDLVLEKESDKNYNTSVIDTNLPNSIWTKTKLQDFGFKCIMNKHDSCIDTNCKCFCHQ